RKMVARDHAVAREAPPHRAVADFMRIAEFVEVEQFGRQRLAARMALAFILVDANPELSGHGERSLWLRAALRALYVPHGDRRHEHRPSRFEVISYYIVVSIALSSGKLY